MNKDNGIIGRMETDEFKKLEEMFAKGENEHMIPIPAPKMSALNNMNMAQRMAWARGHRPSLEDIVAAGGELSPTQQRAYEKRERKQSKNLQQLARSQK